MFFIASTFGELQYQTFDLSVWLLIGFTLCWPHLARYVPIFSQQSKRNETVNMHIDAIFSAAFVILLSTYHFAGTVLAILVVNALFIGLFRLMISTLLSFASVILIWHLVISSIDLTTGQVTAQLIATAFIIIYFGTFAAMGFHLTRQMIRLNKTVKSLSQTDPLTQCYNRLYLDKHLSRELQRSTRLNYPLSIIFADIDHFKKINDEYGHAVGDLILKGFINVVNRAIRNDLDWVARYGGEEFIVVLPNSNSENSVKVAQRIQSKLAKTPIQVESTSLNITCSFGIASKSSETENYNEIINQADKALYLAKDSGRNCIKTAEHSTT